MVSGDRGALHVVIRVNLVLKTIQVGFCLYIFVHANKSAIANECMCTFACALRKVKKCRSVYVY